GSSRGREKREEGRVQPQIPLIKVEIGADEFACDLRNIRGDLRDPRPLFPLPCILSASTDVRQGSSVHVMRLTFAALALLAAAPRPGLAQNVIPELPGAGRPVDLEFTRARRERLLQRLGNAVVAIPAASERSLEKDVLQDNDFRQDDYFFYLTGLETEGAWLVLAAGGGERATVLLLPPRDTSEERWTG